MKPLFSAIAMVIVLKGCSTAHRALPISPETYLIRERVVKVREELLGLGFDIDLSDVDIRVVSAKTMEELFNGIREEAIRQVGGHMPLGPLAADGAVATKANDGRLAFYDPNRKVIVFKKGALRSLTDGYVAHELAHVYQDQRWGFERIWRNYQREPSEEMFNIANFLIEGYAELVRESYEQSMAKNDHVALQEKAELARIIDLDCSHCIARLSSADLPYFFGMRFLAQAFKRGGWLSVEGLLSGMPSSTEQIIHPDKLGIDKPTPVRLPLWRDASYRPRLMRVGVLGEASLLKKLMTVMPMVDAGIGASGWDGDIAHIYKTIDGNKAAVFRILFDRPIDAEQFESSLKPSVSPDEIMRSGRLVDWIIAEEKSVVPSLRAFLKKSRPSLRSDVDDEKTTFAQELSMTSDNPWLSSSPKLWPMMSIGPKLESRSRP